MREKQGIMNVIQITEDNIDDFRDIIPGDIAENIGRQPYHCIALEDGKDVLPAAMVWEYKHLNDETKPTLSRLSWLHADDPDAGNGVFTEYGDTIREVEAEKSMFLLPEAEVSGVEDVYKSAGFDLKAQEGEELTVTVGMLSGLDMIKKGKTPEYLSPLGTLMTRSFRRGLMNCIFHTQRERVEDLSCLPMDWFEPELSCSVQTDDKITGMLLVHKCSSGRLRVEFMSASGPDAKKDLFHMVRFAILQAVANYPSETEVIIPRRDEASRKLAAYFFPNKKGQASVFGERKEN